MNPAFPPLPHALRYVECPRDAWQALPQLIPTAEKAAYLRLLLESGFRDLDLGSFVSPKAVPQMADTEAVLSELPDPDGRDYLCIVANLRGLERAAGQKSVTSVGYPLSVSDAFQRRNSGASLEASWPLVAELQAGAATAGKRLVVYLSMAFGNPDGEAWSVQHSLDALARLRELGVQDIALADTVGRASPEVVSELCGAAVVRFGPEGLGVHLHARAENAVVLAQAAWTAGIRWFEGALSGAGGCPFSGDALVGNLPTELVLPALKLDSDTSETGIDLAALPPLAQQARSIQQRYA